jgi:hypothetical protein
LLAALQGRVVCGGHYGICAHTRAADAKQKAMSCQGIDKLANPSSLVRAQANIPGSGCSNEFYFVFFSDFNDVHLCVN